MIEPTPKGALERLHSIAGGAFLAVGIMGALAIVVFVRPKSSVPPGRTIVRVWQVTGAEDAEKPIVPVWFNQSQNKVHAETIGLPFAEIEQKFLTAVVGNMPPDVFEYFGCVAQWSTRGALMPLDQFIERDHFDRASVFAALWSDMTWDGQIYAIPTGTSNDAFFWNKEHFRKAGLDPEHPPETWDELEQYALRLTTYGKDGSIDQAGYIPGYVNAVSPPQFMVWPLQMGASYLTPDGRTATIATSASISALKWEGDLFQKIGRDRLVLKQASYGLGSQQGFLSGNLSMMINHSSFIQEIERYAPKLDYGVSFIPAPKGGKRAVVAGSVWMGIPEGAKHPEEAWEYIKFCALASTQKQAAEHDAKRHLGGFFPANIEAANSPFQLSLPHMSVFVKSMDFGYSSTFMPLAHGVFWRAYVDSWTSVMRGQSDAQHALEGAQTTVQKALDDQWIYCNFMKQRTHERPRMSRPNAIAEVR